MFPTITSKMSETKPAASTAAESLLAEMELEKHCDNICSRVIRSITLAKEAVASSAKSIVEAHAYASEKDMQSLDELIEVNPSLAERAEMALGRWKEVNQPVNTDWVDAALVESAASGKPISQQTLEGICSSGSTLEVECLLQL